MSDRDAASGPEATARALLPLVGGQANVTSIANCISRLRLGLADRSLVRDQAIRDLPAVMGVVEDDTYQIVLGPKAVTEVAEAFERLVERERADAPAAPADAPGDGDTAEVLAERGAAIRAANKRRNATPFKLFLRRIANIFVPLIPALIACGIIAGVTGLLRNLGWLEGAVPALTAISSGFMSLITVFVGINAAKEFGGTPVLGGAVAAIIPFAGVADVQAFGTALSPGQGGVLGALGAAVLCAVVERRVRRHMPGTLDVLLTPTIAVLVAGLATVFGLMLAAGALSEAIGAGANWLLGQAGAAAGLVLGGLFLPLVMLGLHQALIPIHTTLIDLEGYTTLLPVLSMAGAGQVGAALAVYRRMRHDEGIRSTVRSALPAGLLGVGEPLIYGVTLPLGRPFVTACAGGAVGGAFVGLMGQLWATTGSTAIGPSGWALFPLVQGSAGIGPAVAVYGGGLLVGYVAGFVLTYLFGFPKGGPPAAVPREAEQAPDAVSPG
ncbi:PTS transporter subunit EIIC [Nocardiopsis baichengensis]|uniref:PTS transporter subunit EIIC n=1 Tax=Nocardiopsis baichengensis TaxID=280240 RepID=UPI00034A22C3|nr:PTS transporter subunit EIIC [Nocardiopsis baichengensis]